MQFKTHTEKELFKKIKETYLLGDKNIKPYEHAKISFKRFRADDVVPTQYYFFHDSVYNLLKLQKKFRENQLDILNLYGYVNFYNDELKKEITMIPPIIENINGQDLLIDGTHRIILSKVLNEDINCIYIENSDPKYYPYAVANPNGWKDVQEFDNKTPDGFVTRGHRYEGNYRWYCRMFNFEGEVQIPRTATLKTDNYYREMLEKIKGEINGR